MKKILKHNNLFLRFILKTTIYLSVVFVLHIASLFYFKKPLFENQIVLAYIVNLLLAVLIFKALLFFKKRSNDYLGYIFMYGSLLKFTVFFIFFYPSYNKSVGNSKEEFLAFFTPYVVCLFIEIKSLIHLLNSSEKRDT